MVARYSARLLAKRGGMAQIADRRPDQLRSTIR
jgi:hypothetical protein